MVEAVSGEGRTGRVGFVSILKDLIRDSESGMGAPFCRNGELGPPRLRRISKVCLFQDTLTPNLSDISHGLSAGVPLGLPQAVPDLQTSPRIIELIPDFVLRHQEPEEFADVYL